ncbi:MAG: DUF1499 domain-containing protein [Betaproteobacteria bacterium]
MTTQPTQLDNIFSALQRPGSPNNWLVAPADFIIKPDALAPVFRVSVSVLRHTFKAIVLRSDGVEVAEESTNVIHIIATTRLMRFKDDVWALFIPVRPDQSTVAVYSASRVGYWDTGTNRRRLQCWIEHLQDALNNGKS